MILAALLQRQRTGTGRHIDLSMSEQLLPLMTPSFATVAAEGRDIRRDGEILSGGAPCYRIFRTADGRYISVGALEPKFWLALVEVLGLPELKHINHVDIEQKDDVVEKLRMAFASKTLEEWKRLFAEADACVEPVLTFEEVKRLPQWQARGSFEEVLTPDGRVLTLPKMPASLAGFGR